MGSIDVEIVTQRIKISDQTVDLADRMCVRVNSQTIISTSEDYQDMLA
jgi:hypothetical protein